MKYFITTHNTGSTKSPYAIRLTLLEQPGNMKEIEEWLKVSFGNAGYKLVVVDNSFFYAELYLKQECDATSFVLAWEDSLI